MANEHERNGGTQRLQELQKGVAREYGESHVQESWKPSKPTNVTQPIPVAIPRPSPQTGKESTEKK